MAIKFPSFLPRNDRFHKLMAELSHSVGVCVQHLKAYVESADAQARDNCAAAITASRVEAKRISTTITRELWRSYITPFDREDIQEFAFDLYKIPKIIEKIKERMTLKGLSEDRADFIRQIDLIVQESALLQDMVSALIKKDIPQVQRKINDLYEVETKGDALLNDLLRGLFDAEHSAADLILRRDIYDMLEKVIDRFRDSAGVALRIVLKHS